MRIVKDETIALFVDYQEKLMPVIYDKEAIIKNSAVLARGLGELGVPILVSQQYTKGIGETVPEIKEAISDFTPLEKMSFSCYDSENIKKAIDESNCKNVVLCGTEAHVCVQQTLVDLRAEGYNVILVVDCIGSRTEINKDVALKRAAYEGSILTTYEALLFELTRHSGAPAFKAVSKLVK